MKRTWLVAAVVLPTITCADIEYGVTPLPAKKQVAVSMTVPVPEGSSTMTFRIPQWCPGFYRLIPYHQKIVELSIADESGRAISLETPTTAGAWTVKPGSAKALTVRYAIVGDDPGLGFFGVNVRDHTAFINGPAAFLYVDGLKGEKTKIQFTLPDGWNVATAMDRDPEGRYVNADYDELIDHPIRLGRFERRRFDVNGVPFESVWVSANEKYRPDFEAENAMLEKVSRATMDLFGGKPPFKRYLYFTFKRYLYFIHLGVGDFAGGLEHRSSTVIALPNSKPMGMETLAAHEFFHAWNVKQIRPQVLGPFDYTQPNRTGNLWFSEGVTDYYAQIMCYRAGLFEEQWLLGALADEINSLQRSGMRLSAERYAPQENHRRGEPRDLGAWWLRRRQPELLHEGPRDRASVGRPDPQRDPGHQIARRRDAPPRSAPPPSQAWL